MTNIPRYGVVGYGMEERRNGQWVSRQDVVQLLKSLTDDDSREAILIAISDSIEELREATNDNSQQ